MAVAKHQVFRALGMAAFVFFTSLLIYERPPELAMLWQPALQAGLAFLGSLGFGTAVKSGRP